MSKHQATHSDVHEKAEASHDQESNEASVMVIDRFAEELHPDSVPIVQLVVPPTQRSPVKACGVGETYDMC